MMNKKEALEVLQDLIGERENAWQEFERGHCDEAIIDEVEASFDKAFEALEVLRKEWTEEEQDTAPEILWGLGYFYCQRCHKWLPDKMLCYTCDDCTLCCEGHGEDDE